MLNTFSNTPPDVTSLMELVDTYVRWSENSKTRSYEYYHPSEFGKCLRASQYKRYAEKGIIDMTENVIDGRTYRLFQKGHNMQSRWEKYFLAMGVLRGIWKCSNTACQKIYGADDKLGVFKPDVCECGNKHFWYNEVSVEDKKLNMRGNVDLILDFSRFNAAIFGDKITKTFNEDLLPKTPIVVDMKTINERGFENLDKYHKPPGLGYQVQLTIYANLLDVEYGVLIYECKNDSRIRSYKIPRNEHTWFKLIQRQSEQLDEMTRIEKDGKTLNLLPPPRPKNKSCYDCRGYPTKGIPGCPFKKICHTSGIWKDPNFDAKRKKFYGFLLDS